VIRLGLCLAAVAAVVGASAAAPAEREVAYRAPLPLQVVRPFEAPATPYGPGHRGVDLAATPGVGVRAAGAGVVSFAGRVAGRGVVVLLHPDGVRTEYEPVRPAVRAGEAVTAGQLIARVSGQHGSCAPGRCLHWGARRGTEYFDPLLLLRRLGPVRLLPWD
jgi:murein DD-endopeptidase MepM/ murein hydrolase activator NlpD